MLDLSQFDPAEIGLPETFSQFRTCQQEAVEMAANSAKRFVGLALPTGSGKSLVAVALARATGMRTAILTATRGLQEQYLAEMGKLLTDIRGKANYRCVEKPNLSCRFGPHEGCKYPGGEGCAYEDQKAQAKRANVVLTNYAYWLRANERGRGLELSEKEEGPDPVELLILDEGHRVMEELSRGLNVTLRESWLRAAGIKKMGADYEHCENVWAWAEFAADWKADVGAMLKGATAVLRHKPSSRNRERVYELEELLQALQQIARMDSESWVCELRQGTRWGRLWQFDCVWPGAWAEARLFVGIPKVVMLSATLRPLAMQLLNIAASEMEFREWPRIFPANHTPVYYGLGVRLNHKSSEEDLKEWVKTIDAIIGSRLDRKGLVHTVSYARQKYLLEHSKYACHFFANTSDPESATAAETVAEFKAKNAPAVLVSPSFSTGWDFPGRTCEWQIIAKVPYPDSRSKVMQERKKRSPKYIDYLAMQDLVQAAGRGSRSVQDRCECFVVDTNVGWFMARNKGLAPQWFQLQKVSELPPPGKRAEC